MMADLKAQAQAQINSGSHPDDLVHLIYMGEDVVLSSPLPAGSDLTGYTSRYYTLGSFL